MPITPILYDDKVAIIVNPNPEENKWTDDNANEIKTVVNAIIANLEASREVTGSDSIVAADDNTVVVFNSASPFNFTLDQLPAKSKISFFNIGAGAVTFIAGSGVTITGDVIIPAAAGTSFPTAFVFYHTLTTPRVIGGGSVGDGDVVGPASAVADQLALYTDTTGKLIKAGPQVATLYKYYGPSTTGVNTYVTTLSPVLAALASGVKVTVKFSDASTGASTLNPNSLGAKKMYKDPSTQIGNGDITDEQSYEFVYDAALDGASGGWMRLGAGASSSLSVAAVADINTGTDNSKYLTSLGMQGSKYETQYRLRSFAPSTTAANTYTASLSPAITTYGSGGLLLSIKFTNHNTGAATLNVNGLGALAIVRNDGSALQASDIGDNFTGLLQYDGTSLILVNARGSSGGSAWTTSVAGLVERSTQAEAQAVITQFLAGGSTGLSGSRTGSELELLDILNSLGIYPQVKTLTASAGGGASGTFTMAMAGIRWGKFIPNTTWTGNVTIALTTAGASDPFELAELLISVTGSITLTFDSNVRIPDGTPGYTYAAHTVSIVSGGTGVLYRITFTKAGSTMVVGISSAITV